MSAALADVHARARANSMNADVLRYRSPRSREETTAFIGMVIFLGSWAIMFAALFFAYGFVRLRAPFWPPPDLPALPIGWPAANTVVLFLSSVCLEGSLRVLRSGGRGAPTLLGASALLGVLFVVLQTVVWVGLHAAGLRPTGGPYPSVFYALTAVHGLHVVVGLFALGGLAIRAAFGAYGPAKYLPVRLWALYWHFVGVVWGILFVTVYLV